MSNPNSDVTRLLEKIAPISKHHREIARLTGENFNLIDILKLGNYEVKTHSPILTELLDPQGSHGQGSLFLELFISQLKKTHARHLTEFEQSDYKNSTTTPEKHIGSIDPDNTEGGQIDIYIENENSLIIIENKIHTKDGENQLLRYYNHGKESKHPFLLIYLTLDGSEPENFSEGVETSMKKEIQNKVINLSYHTDIIRWLRNCRKEVSTCPIIRETITIYINLLKTLTNQNIEQIMSSQIATEILESKISFESYTALRDSSTEVNTMLQKMLERKLSKLAANTLKMQFEALHHIFAKEYSFSFRNETWPPGLWICFESLDDNSLNYGFWHDPDNSDKADTDDKWIESKKWEKYSPWNEKKVSEIYFKDDTPYENFISEVGEKVAELSETIDNIITKINS